MLWVDDYRPKSLGDLHYHVRLSQRLKSLAASGDFPHMLFYGPSGAGKKTRISATLNELFGSGVEKLKIDQRVFLTPSRKKLDVNVVQSNYHIELTPSEVGNYDRVVIQEILKEIAQTQQVDVSARHRFKGDLPTFRPPRVMSNLSLTVVVINEADTLSRDAQAALRRTMEKYMTNLRIILCANSTSRLIAPIKSRCLLIRVAAPSHEEMLTVLNHVAKRAGAGSLPEDVADGIITDANGNMRKAILVFEAMKMQSPDLSNSPPIAKPDWETYCSKVADMIIQEQTPQRVMEVRAKLYELLSHCIPATIILKTVADRVVQKVDESLKADIMHWAAIYENRMRLGNKKIYHLEAWVVRVMSLYKQSFLGIEFADLDDLV
ncbi:P-loop containing nucleoside triphosphate hydrolase protein [Russula earlei]|uniref:P-loop containing nucleoside triphosphate hydrolase protein n=1 Tax=Russula earlei TaxID=71964 RepID=A0ACC0UDX6_9AGAM|nr:P-loop containing nucleoside triphosphate hydrolase protein [Russula earlei]